MLDDAGGVTFGWSGNCTANCTESADSITVQGSVDDVNADLNIGFTLKEPIKLEMVSPRLCQ